MPFPPATESSSGLPHRETRDGRREEDRKQTFKKLGTGTVMDREAEQERKRRGALTYKDVTASKKEGSARACC